MHAESSVRASVSRGGCGGRGVGGGREVGGFTLIEILVVIVIIGILVAVAMTLATRVTQGGRARLTEDTIRVLDVAVDAYVSAKEEKFPAFYLQPESGVYFPLCDGRWAQRRVNPGSMTYDKTADFAQPTIALAMGVMSGVPTADAALKQIDQKLVTRHLMTNGDYLNAYGWYVVAPTGPGIPGGAPPGGPFGNHPGVRPIPGVEIKDAWGNPLRMVHPAFDGGHGQYFDSVSQTMVSRPDLLIVPQRPAGIPAMLNVAFSRSYRPFDPTSTSGAQRVGDADEGICPGGGRPYFYSAGPDGDPGTRADNVYTTKPEYPAETVKQLE